MPDLPLMPQPVIPGVAEAARPAATGKSAQQIRDAAHDQAMEFESVFLTTFVQQMFSGIETDGPFGGGQSEEIYRSMMAEEYATTIARAGGVGIADHVYAEILKSQQIDP